MKSRKQVKNSPKVPSSVPTSTMVGRYIAQPDGRNAWCSEVTMITNRSNHMPTLTSRQTTSSTAGVVRTFRSRLFPGARPVALDQAATLDGFVLVLRAPAHERDPILDVRGAAAEREEVMR